MTEASWKECPGRTHILSGPGWGLRPGAWGCRMLHKQKEVWPKCSATLPTGLLLQHRGLGRC